MCVCVYFVYVLCVYCIVSVCGGMFERVSLCICLCVCVCLSVSLSLSLSLCMSFPCMFCCPTFLFTSICRMSWCPKKEIVHCSIAARPTTQTTTKRAKSYPSPSLLVSSASRLLLPPFHFHAQPVVALVFFLVVVIFFCRWVSC